MNRPEPPGLPEWIGAGLWFVCLWLGIVVIGAGVYRWIF